MPSFHKSGLCCMPHGVSTILSGSQTHFATAAVVKWLPLFSMPNLAQIVLKTLERMHEEETMVLHAYCLLENQLHVIGSSPDFRTGLQQFRTETTKEIVNALRHAEAKYFLDQLRFVQGRRDRQVVFRIWQDSFLPEVIPDEETLVQKIEYVHMRPVKRGYVSSANHWRYSSSAQYSGSEGLIPINPLLPVSGETVQQ